MYINKNITIYTGRSKECYSSKPESVCCFTRDGAKSLKRLPICWECSHEYKGIDELFKDIRSGYMFCSIYQVPFPDKKIYTKEDSIKIEKAIRNLKRKRGKSYNPTKDEYEKICSDNYIKRPETPFFSREKELRGFLKTTYRDSRFLYGTQIIWIDIDECYFNSIEDFNSYLGNLKILPTLYYTTWSDGVNGRRRLRLLYVFDKILSPAEAETIANRIVEIINKPLQLESHEWFYLYVDPCSKKLTQSFYGNPRPDTEYYLYDLIYEKSDFLNPNDILFWTGDESVFSIDFDSDLTGFLYNNWEYGYRYYIISYDINKKGNKKGYRQLEKYEIFWTGDEDLFSDIVVTPEGHKVRIWKKDYPNYLPPLDENNKLSDGCHRRKILSIRAMIRRLMRPDENPNTILYNMYMDMVRFMEYTGKNELKADETLDWMKDVVTNLFNKNIDKLYQEYHDFWNSDYWDYEETENGISRYDIKRTYEKQITSLDGTDYMTLHKELRWMEYDEILKGKEFNTTNKEKMEILKANRIIVKERAFKDYTESRGYLKKNWKQFISKGMEFKEVKEILINNGFNVSDKTIRNYLYKLNK